MPLTKPSPKTTMMSSLKILKDKRLLNPISKQATENLNGFPLKTKKRMGSWSSKPGDDSIRLLSHPK